MIRIMKFLPRRPTPDGEQAEPAQEVFVEHDDNVPSTPLKEELQQARNEGLPRGRRAKPAQPGFAGNSSAMMHLASDLTGGSRAHRHAFAPSRPVADLRRLAGRSELLQRLIRAIEDQDLHAVLYGDRGIGKTSVLRVVQGLASEAGYLVHYVSCGPSATFCEIFRGLAAKIPLLYDNRADPTSSAALGGATLADRLGPGDFSVSQLTDVLSGIDGIRVLLILDEFDRSDVDDFRRPVGELVKNLSDRLIKVQLLIGGVARNITDLVTQIPSIRRNIVGIGVPPLTSDEVIEMIDIAESFGEVRFDAQARERLVQVSGGLPYLVGLLGQHATLLAVADGSRWISGTHIDQAVGIGSQDIESRLSARCGHAINLLLHGPQAATLLAAARDATRDGGIVVAPNLTARLAAHGDDFANLLVPIPDDPQGAWGFVEDGAASLIWLHSLAAPVKKTLPPEHP